MTTRRRKYCLLCHEVIKLYKIIIIQEKNAIQNSEVEHSWEGGWWLDWEEQVEKKCLERYLGGILSCKKYHRRRVLENEEKTSHSYW